METSQLQAMFTNSIKPIEYMLRDQIDKIDSIWEYAHKFQCQNDEFNHYIDLALFKSNSRIRPLINFYWMDSDLIFFTSPNSAKQPDYRDSKFWSIIIKGDEPKKIERYSDFIFSRIESTEYCFIGTAQSQDNNFEQYLKIFIKCVDILAKEILPINDFFTKSPYIYIPIIVINKKIQRCILSTSMDFTYMSQLENPLENTGYCQYQKKYQSNILDYQKPSKFDDLKDMGRRTILIVQADHLIQVLKLLPVY